MEAIALETTLLILGCFVLLYFVLLCLAVDSWKIHQIREKGRQRQARRREGWRNWDILHERRIYFDYKRKKRDYEELLKILKTGSFYVVHADHEFIGSLHTSYLTL